MKTLNETLLNLESKQPHGGEDGLKAQLELLEKQLDASQKTGEADREKLHSVEKTLQKVGFLESYQ